MNSSHSFLRFVLKLQAVTELAVGLACVAGASWLASTLQLPQSLLLISGGLAVVFGAFIYHVATRPHLAARSVWIIIAINAVWAIDCVVALVGGWLETNALGTAVVIAEAVVAAIIAEVELIALKRTRATVTAAVS